MPLGRYTVMDGEGNPVGTEVMVNGADDVYVERKGRIEMVWTKR